MDTSIGHALRLHDSGTNNKYIRRYDIGFPMYTGKYLTNPAV